MEYVTTLPVSRSLTHSSVGRKQVSQYMRGGTTVRLQRRHLLPQVSPSLSPPRNLDIASPVLQAYLRSAKCVVTRYVPARNSCADISVPGKLATLLLIPSPRRVRAPPSRDSPRRTLSRPGS